MQGVVRSFDPGNGEGVLVATDGSRAEFLLAADALEGSIFRMLRQGQRVNFDVDATGQATRVRIGSRGRHGPPPRHPGVGPGSRAAGGGCMSDAAHFRSHDRLSARQGAGAGAQRTSVAGPERPAPKAQERVR